MKNILKKLGVLGLIVAVLAPFIELPDVNAASTNCTTNLQNYLFLDMNSPSSFIEYDDEGYATYGNFTYVFPDTGTVTIKNVTTVSPNTEAKLGRYWELYNTIMTHYKYRYYYDYGVNGELTGNVFVAENTSNYTTNTILTHGKWARYDEYGKEYDSNWNDTVSDDATDYTIPKIALKNNKTTFLNALNYNSNITDSSTNQSGVMVYPANYSNTGFTDYSSNINLAEYFQQMANSDTEGSIPLKIRRVIQKEVFEDNNIIFGYQSGGKTYAFSKTETEGAINASAITNSYEAYRLYESNQTTYAKYIKEISDGNANTFDVDTTKSYYWPVVVNVVYESCTTVNAEWVVEYDDNVDDTSVTNLPEPQKESLGTDIKVSTVKPSRSGYVFKKWCEAANGSGTCYEPGDTIKSPTESKTIKLFAQWGPDGTTDNKKTGVISYIIGFAAVGVVAGGIYLISKKKNLFKQI